MFDARNLRGPTDLAAEGWLVHGGDDLGLCAPRLRRLPVGPADAADLALLENNVKSAFEIYLNGTRSMQETRRGLRSNWRLKRLLRPIKRLSDASDTSREGRLTDEMVEFIHAPGRKALERSPKRPSEVERRVFSLAMTLYLFRGLPA